jgi:hypothetical protein
MGPYHQGCRHYAAVKGALAVRRFGIVRALVLHSKAAHPEQLVPGSAFSANIRFLRDWS